MKYNGTFENLIEDIKYIQDYSKDYNLSLKEIEFKEGLILFHFNEIPLPSKIVPNRK